MATPSTQPATRTPAVSRPKYRSLNRDINEFRLLKILPPTNTFAAGTGPLEFPQDPIRCELHYESFNVLSERLRAKQLSTNSILAYLLQDTPRLRGYDSSPSQPERAGKGVEGVKTVSYLKTSIDETEQGAFMETVGSYLGSKLSVDKEAAHAISPGRIEALQEKFESSKQTLELWQPDGIQLPSKSFQDWMSSWIWTPLSGDTEHLEHKSLGYFALSYVWRDSGRVSLATRNLNRELNLMNEGSGMALRKALEFLQMSPETIEGICGQDHDLVDDSVEIIVDGILISVGKNLEKALRTLREIPEISNGTRVWVDALCINQGDFEEKNVEVKRMGEIYREADRVVSYLGEESDQSGDVLEFMNAVGDVIQRVSDLTPIILGFLKNVQADMAFSMAKFLLRTYLTRIWIVQEIVLGGEKSVLICGARRFPWTNILRCGKMLNAGMAATSWNLDTKLGPLQNEKGEVDDYLTMADWKSGITKLQMFRDAGIFSRRMLQEEELEGQGHIQYSDVHLSNTLWFRIPSSNNATDPRDLIYGMMSLLPKKLTDLIAVDYGPTNGFTDVMRAFAEAHLACTQSLHLILHRYYSPFLGHQEWPTWVPNLAQRFSSGHWDWAINSEGTACPNIPCRIIFARNRETRKPLLVCSGVKIDTIHMATRNIVMDTFDRKQQLIQTLSASITDENVAQVYQTIEDLRGSLGKQTRLIIPEKDDERTPVQAGRGQPVASTHRYGNTEGLKRALDKCFKRFKVELEGGQSIFNFPLDISEEDGHTLRQVLGSREFKAPMVTSFNMIRDFFANFRLWDTSFRRLFPARAANVDPASYSSPNIDPDATLGVAHLITTCGGYVGTCLGNVRPGDEVFLLAGCSMPVLLRKSGLASDTYKLQSSLYIPGIMEGEALGRGGYSANDFKEVLLC